MRGLLVNNEDLLRTNAQLTNDSKRMREHMMELERENQVMGEKYRQMEVGLTNVCSVWFCDGDIMSVGVVL